MFDLYKDHNTNALNKNTSNKNILYKYDYYMIVMAISFTAGQTLSATNALLAQGLTSARICSSPELFRGLFGVDVIENVKFNWNH